MPPVEITIHVTGNPLAAMRGRLLNLRPAFERIVVAWRALISEEFDEEAWRPQSGPMRSWLPTKAFGNQPAPDKTLQRTGALRRAWVGTGAGSIENITNEFAEFGVSTVLLPYARIHRGGTGQVTAAESRQPFVIRVTEKMRWFLGLAKGVWLRKTTETVTIPRRPHATINPEIKTNANIILNTYLLRGSREIPSEAL